MADAGIIYSVTLLLGVSITAIIVLRLTGLGSVIALLCSGLIIGLTISDKDGQLEELRHIAELGIIFLLFLIGLEMAPARLWALRRSVFGFGLAQVVVTGTVLSLGAWMLGNPINLSLIVGFAMALSSTAFVLQLLEERNERHTHYGEKTFAVLLLQDLAVVPLLALAGFLAGQLDSTQHGTEVIERNTHSTHVFDPVIALLMLMLVVVAGRFLIPFALDYAARNRQAGIFAAIAAFSAAASAWSMQMAGLSVALGSFLIGVLLSSSRYHRQIEADILPFKNMLLALFFITVGMSIDLFLLKDQLFLVLAVVAVIVIVKATIVFVLARLFGSSIADSLRLAAILPQGGEFAFVLLGFAVATELMSQELFVQNVLVISISMALTPFLIKAVEPLASRLERSESQASPVNGEESYEVILCGFGRVGRTIALMLDAFDVSYVALELNPKKLAGAELIKGKVIYGNAADHSILRTIGAHKAKAMIITLDSIQQARTIVEVLGNFYPEVPTIVRAANFKEAATLLSIGAKEAMPEFVEVSIGLGGKALSILDIAEDDLIAHVQLLKDKDYEVLRNSDLLT